MLLFVRDSTGFYVYPHSVIAWLYYKKSPKLAELFCEAFNKTSKDLEKKWNKHNTWTSETKLKLNDNTDKEEEKPLKWYQKKLK